MVSSPDYKNSILNVTSSILKHFDIEPYHSTLPVLDGELENNYKNIVLIILDGMGVNVLERNLPADSFLRRNIKSEISSVFPCTTTAALTSLQSGLTPNEHGWIGWSNYFSEVDKCVDMFSGNESGTQEKASKGHLPNKILGYRDIVSKINESSKAYYVSPYSKYYANSIEQICMQIKKLCKTRKKKFIYAYHWQPDHDMHDFGVENDKIKALLMNFDKNIKELSTSISNTLMIITADHGMTDVTMKSVEDYPQIEQMLERHICIEPRCCSFFIKEKYKNDFKDIFSDCFGNKFRIYNHIEFLESGLLGNGTPHPKVKEFVGDFIAVAVGDTALWYKDCNGEANDFKGAHAGLTKEEMTVPLIIVKSPKEKRD